MLQSIQKKPTIESVFTDPINNGIFKALKTNHYDALINPYLDDSTLDLEYFKSMSGDKQISPMVESLLGSNGKLSDANIKLLGDVIYRKFGEQWKRYYQVMLSEYNPIDNYSLTEHEESTASGDSSVYGFNSTEAQPQAESGAENERDLTRSGNIGVTTSTKMMQEHVDFWKKWNFYNELFNSVDEILTLSIY